MEVPAPVTAIVPAKVDGVAFVTNKLVSVVVPADKSPAKVDVFVFVTVRFVRVVVPRLEVAAVKVLRMVFPVTARFVVVAFVLVELRVVRLRMVELPVLKISPTTSPPPAPAIQTPPIAKQPEVKLIPPPKVEVEEFVTKRLVSVVVPADKSPAKSDVFVFVTVRFVRVVVPRLEVAAVKVDRKSVV